MSYRRNIEIRGRGAIVAEEFEEITTAEGTRFTEALMRIRIDTHLWHGDMDYWG